MNNPEVVKEMNQSISWELGKPSYITKRLAPMLGNGILRSNGHSWAQQRKIVAPEFFMDKVKVIIYLTNMYVQIYISNLNSIYGAGAGACMQGMVGLMVESAESLSDKWEAEAGGKMVEIKAEEDLRSFSADVISKACFGSSYLKGKQIFSKLRTLQKAISSTQSFLFGSHAFGYVQKSKIDVLEKEIERLIWEAVEERESKCKEEENKDLLHLILEGAVNNDVDKDSSKRFIVDNCKNIYFAGHESTAVAASWCLMLLALHPSWQAKIRSEMATVCHPTAGRLTADSLPKLKTVSRSCFLTLCRHRLIHPFFENVLTFEISR